VKFRCSTVHVLCILVNTVCTTSDVNFVLWQWMHIRYHYLYIFNDTCNNNNNDNNYNKKKMKRKKKNGNRNLFVSNQWLQSFTRVDINEATLLGAPLFQGPALDKAWTDRCDGWWTGWARWVLRMLWSSFSAPDVIYLICMSVTPAHLVLLYYNIPWILINADYWLK